MRSNASPTALVVEDDEHMAYLLRRMLERDGYAVRVLHDGAAAMALIQRESPVDIALLDLLLPVHGGQALVQAMRATPGWERVPAILMTLKSQEGSIARALQAGADDYIVKPFHPDEVMARVRCLAQRVVAS